MNEDANEIKSFSPETAPAEEKPRSKKLKVLLIVIVVILVLAAILYFFKSVFIAAMVDGRPISRLAVVKELEQQSGKDTLEGLINRRLIDNEIKKNNITIDSGVVDQEISKIRTQIEGQGGTLEDALVSEHLTMKTLRDNIDRQKKVEKLLSDKVQVSDEEVDQYIKNNNLTVPAENADQFRSGIKDQIKSQKLNSEVGALVNRLRQAAKINYFVNY